MVDTIDWPGAIVRNRAALLRIVAPLRNIRNYLLRISTIGRNYVPTVNRRTSETT